MKKLAMLAVLLVACGGDDGDGDVVLSAPSCQQAMTSYYAAGCGFSGDLGPLTAEQMTGRCLDLLISTDDIADCEAAVDYWLICLDGVTGNVGAQCDCSVEQEDVITCG